MSSTDTTILDLDALLDAEMGSVETLPDYVTPSAGVYIITITGAEIKAGKAKEGKPATPRIITTFRIDNTLECVDVPFPDGSLFTDSYQGTDEGLKYFKKQAMKLLGSSEEDMQSVKLRDILEALREVKQLKIVVTSRTTKDDSGKEYTNISIRPVQA